MYINNLLFYNIKTNKNHFNIKQLIHSVIKMKMKKIVAWFFVLILLFGGVCICTMYI